ncbi:MAG: 3-dehydroquinate synthase [Luminiphilus sp.]|jgi:3-dehydroquinate synthase
MSSRAPEVMVRLAAAGSDRSYPIHIGPNLLAQGDLLRALVGDRNVCLVTNETIAPLFQSSVLNALHDNDAASRKVTVVELPDGEAHKTLASYERILTSALEDKHERSTVFIALGGGVIGDMTGFAAASFLRGADFIQVPTTLLSQVDSSVGGKTGVNHPMGKNLIGAFHQPIGVIIDTQTLETLPDREYAAGMAEVIKYGLIADANFFDYLIGHTEALVRRDEALLADVIARCCAIKADVVKRDEREGGVRAILNFGHTFGHAIEKEQGFGVWLHGEAVAAGMAIAARISAGRGAIEPGTVAALAGFLQAFSLPIHAPDGMGVDAFMSAMQGDKKVQAGKIRYVLLESLGNAFVTPGLDESEIALNL